MKNKVIEVIASLGAVAILGVGLTIPAWGPLVFDWLKNDSIAETTLEVKQITLEQIDQQKILEDIKKAEGYSVLLRTEKVGDNVKPLTVRHYARLSETGEIVYWTEVTDDQPPD